MKGNKTIGITACACCAAVCIAAVAAWTGRIGTERQPGQEMGQETEQEFAGEQEQDIEEAQAEEPQQDFGAEEPAAQAGEQAVQADAPAASADATAAPAGEQTAQPAAPAGEAPVPALNEEQKKLLDRLSAQIRAQRYDEAARLMFEKSDELAELYYEVMDQERFLYRDGRLSEPPDGDGLVLARSSLVFCGSFASGTPEGSCTALQIVELDYPRYDFASGEWKDGKMNGSGATGYCFYEGAGEENRQMIREGEFLDNRMNGPVRLSTVNAHGEESTWEMTADDGALVLDEAWLYDDADDSYRLPAEQDPSHAYLVTGNEAPGIRFENLILWE